MGQRCLKSAFLVAGLAWLASPASGPDSPPVSSIGAPSMAETPVGAKWMGVSSCSARACHGGVTFEPPPNEHNEHTTWILRDKHARAYAVLRDDLISQQVASSQQIARNLGIKQAEASDRCLVCHAPGAVVPHGPRYNPVDGVDCESCHGPAEKWLEPHQRRDQRPPRKQLVDKFGMTDTKDVSVRATICVGCHVGAPGREVDHELLAAGHPPLVFELDVFTLRMPPHWKETKEPPDKPATFGGARAWAVGQAVVLEQSLKLLRARADDARWPEFAEFECTACHHMLGKQPWRQDQDFSKRRPGSPIWSSPQWLLVQQLAAFDGKPVSDDSGFDSLRDLLTRPNARAAEVRAAAQKLLPVSSQLIEQIASRQWTAEQLRRLLHSLSDASQYGAFDYATAVQIVMALGAVSDAIAREESHNSSTTSEWRSRLRPAFDRLYDRVEQSKGFDAVRFVGDLRAFQSLLAK